MVNPIKSSRNSKETNQIPKLQLFSISKSTSENLPIQSMLMAGVISVVVTPKDKTKSKLLTNQKVMSITKSVVSF